MPILPVIILEDSQERIKKFKSEIPRADIYVDAQSCIDRILEMQESFIIFLDHDLGNEIYVDSNLKNTGMEVVRFIQSWDHKYLIHKAYIHSLNESAAKEMESKLIELGIWVRRIPYIQINWKGLGI